MITIFNRFRRFFDTLFVSIKQAYEEALANPPESGGEKWRDIDEINLVAVFISKLNNLCNTEATFDVESDSTRAEPLFSLCKDLEKQRFTLTENMLADGDYYVFPATDGHGRVYHSYLTGAQVRLTSIRAGEIREAYGIIDWYVERSGRAVYLLRKHTLSDDGTLEIAYESVNESGKAVESERFASLAGQRFRFAGANHIGFGRYKSPVSDRGLSPVYGVPLNFGCEAVEERIKHDLKLIREEFDNAKSRIFADPLILRRKGDGAGGKDASGGKDGADGKKERWNIPENIFPIQKRAGVTGSEIEIFNPNIRQTEHYENLMADMALYEKQVGTSRGILTENQSTETATATAVKRANADTVALIGKIRDSIDAGNRMTLCADSVFLNIPCELWTYRSDWYDPFEDPSEQWKRLLEAKNNGAVEQSDLIAWLYPSMTAEEIEGKRQRIEGEKKAETAAAIDRILSGDGA